MSNQIYRIVKILSRLSAGHTMTSHELLAHLLDDPECASVTLRTIQRDLENINTAGVGLLVRSDGKQKRYALPRGSGLNLFSRMPSSPLLDLHLLKAALPQFAALDPEGRLSDLKGEVLSADLIASVTLGEYAGTSSIATEDLDRIITAIGQKRWIRVTYRDKAKGMDLFPYKLIPYTGRLYLAAWHPVHKATLTLATDQIREVRESRSKETAPRFSIDKFMECRFGLWESRPARKIVVHVAREIIHEIILRRWHPTQTFQELDNGDMEMTMRTGVTHELVSWILHWTPWLTVIEPAELREKVRERMLGSAVVIERGE